MRLIFNQLRESVHTLRLNIMSNQFRFRPISNSWVAIHPNPKGVVQFIGGAFFGTFPTFFYRYFLNQLFDAGYTIIALPFRFTFNHWSVAISLVKEQYVIRREIVKQARSLGYDYELYLRDSNFFWVGHSLGCKYIALLEILSGEWSQLVQNIKKCGAEKTRYTSNLENLENLSLELDWEKSKTEVLTEKYVGEKPEIINLFIKGQPSLLIAPDISNTESAIPIRFLARLIDNIGLGVTPNLKQTRCLIKHSDLFNLIALVCFKQDEIAKETCNWIVKELNTKSEQSQDRLLPIAPEQLDGKHLEPIGVKIGNYIVDLNPLDKFIEPIESRKLESVAVQLLEELKQRQKEMDREKSALDRKPISTMSVEP